MSAYVECDGCGKRLAAGGPGYVEIHVRIGAGNDGTAHACGRECLERAALAACRQALELARTRGA